MKPYKPYFPEFWSEHERHWKEPRRATLKSLFLYEYRYDKDGIIYMQEKGLQGRKKVYHPITVIQHALMFYNEYIKNRRKDELRSKFERYAEWLWKNKDEDRERIYWALTFPMKMAGYKCTRPYRWVSGMVQGMVLSVLIRYDSLNPSRKHKQWAKKILGTIELPIEQGGVKDIVYGDWYDEFTGHERGHALNGFMYALMSLWECWKYFSLPQAKKLFTKGVETLKERLPEFDLHWEGFHWSRYDNKRIYYSGVHYHKVHVHQLKILAKITRDPRIKAKYLEWERYGKKYLAQAKRLDLIVLPVLKMEGIIGL